MNSTRSSHSPVSADPGAPQALDTLVIGAGPAGLMAAEVLAGQGARVVLAEAMPTPARKFLMAGKSGLNLTKDESPADFAARFSGALPRTPGYLDMKERGPLGPPL